MKYYTCKFTATSGAYSLDAYDLRTKKKKEIKAILKDQGYKGLEIYDIKEQS
jgi:hypothetical protein